MRTIPDVNAARTQFSVNRIEKEGIRQSLYDFLIYPTAGANQFSFFQQQQGQGLSSHPGNANAVKTIADTNMEAAGQLPNPKNFLVESIEVFFEPGSVATANTFTPVAPQFFAAVAAATIGNFIQDQNVIRITGELQFFIGSKSYLDEAPLGRFPGKTRPEFNGAIASNSATTAASGAYVFKAGGRPYYVEPSVFLESTQNFKVTLNFPVAQATPSGFNGRIGVILDGYLYRNAQ